MKKTYDTNEQELPLANEDIIAISAPQQSAIDASFHNTLIPPCSFSDEEWEEEIRLSEESGIANEEETSSFYKKWGIAL